MVSSRISELASVIAGKTAEVDEYLSSKNITTPSFDPEFPYQSLLHPDIIATRQAILEATNELHALMLGPLDVLVPNVRIGLHSPLTTSVFNLLTTVFKTSIPTL